VLQVSSNAEPDTIHRIYRLMAQRFHPDNRETGDDARFRAIHEAYVTLSDPERRAKYDIYHQQLKQNRWRMVAAGAKAEEDFELEQITRLTVLEALHANRRLEPGTSGLPTTELETLIGRPREHLEFTIWYLVQKKLVHRDDSARLLITADGVDFLEQNYRANLQRRRLQAPSTPV
jgi:curved DNA-binding protein CbpA